MSAALETSSSYCKAVNSTTTCSCTPSKTPNSYGPRLANQRVQELCPELGTVQPRPNAVGLHSPRIHDTQMQNPEPQFSVVVAPYQPTYVRRSTHHPHGLGATSSDVARPADGRSVRRRGVLVLLCCYLIQSKLIFVKSTHVSRSLRGVRT